jgi:CheY-like chemotaxis protein
VEVLVVDDEPDLRLLMRFVLQKAGIQVHEAGDGRQGLAHLQEHLPDVVVLDVQMPDLDGLATLDAIRSGERTRDVPVVLCTVKSRVEDVLRGWELGCDGYVTKPFENDALLSEVLAAGTRTATERARVRLQGSAVARARLALNAG